MTERGKRCVDVGPVTRAGVHLGVADLAAFGHREEATQLEPVAFDARLHVAGAGGAQGGEQAPRAKGAQCAALQAECPVGLSGRIGVDLEARDLSVREVLREWDCAVADEDEDRPRGLDVVAPAAQLRSRLLAVRSTEVADVGEHEWPLLGEVAEIDLVAPDVENGQVRQLSRHVSKVQQPQYGRVPFGELVTRAT